MKTGGTTLTRTLAEALGQAAVHPLRVELEVEDPADAPSALLSAKANIHDLLAIDAETGEQILAYSVHMPAWVAEAVAPEYLRFTVVREPVSRTISHLKQVALAPGVPDTIEELYSLEVVRDRLADYQTRMLAVEKADQPRRISPTELREFMANATQVERDNVTFELTMANYLGTPHVDPLNDGHLDRALSRLEAFDVVGTTERMSDAVRRVEQATGWSLPEPERHNVTRNTEPVSAELIERIEADTRLDRQLYERAVELSA